METKSTFTFGATLCWVRWAPLLRQQACVGIITHTAL